ncbi:hypothetical protein PGT21_029425 [Puccinia graminis f. sp. tritici]|uniref:Uncharacterized protein n=1 Tax=Puccinia graminis f. sp. tritici TaxID=56615 RepID=A0A5B0R1X9_PUCGR|nr:hypothetical protein PGT21_029425 [Puccinia graminis f. sp. tritici]
MYLVDRKEPLPIKEKWNLRPIQPLVNHWNHLHISTGSEVTLKEALKAPSLQPTAYRLARQEFHDVFKSSSPHWERDQVAVQGVNQWYKWRRVVDSLDWHGLI